MTHSHDTSTPAVSDEALPSEDFVRVPKEFLDFLRHAPVGSGTCCCGDDMQKHSNSEHSPVDMWDHDLDQWLKQIATLPASHLAKEGGEAGAVEPIEKHRIANRLRGMFDMSVPSEGDFNRLTPAGFRLLRQAHDALIAPDEAVAAPAPNPSPAAKGGDAVREALVENIEAFLAMHRKGILTPRTPNIPVQLLEKSLAALSTPTEGPASQTEGMGGDAPRLLSCPFCGGAPTLHPHSPDHMLGAWVSCSTCGLESPTETGRSVEAAVQHWNTRAALTPPETAEAVPPLYLIRKGGAFYRPNSQGYTRSIAEAGRYSLAEAEAITHPNGPNGPRDGMDYIPAPALASDPAPATDDRERLVEAFIAGATAVHEEIKRDHPEAVPRGDPEFYEAAQDYARAALATEASR